MSSIQIARSLSWLLLITISGTTSIVQAAIIQYELVGRFASGSECVSYYDNQCMEAWYWGGESIQGTLTVDTSNESPVVDYEIILAPGQTWSYNYNGQRQWSGYTITPDTAYVDTTRNTSYFANKSSSNHLRVWESSYRGLLIRFSSPIDQPVETIAVSGEDYEDSPYDSRQFTGQLTLTSVPLPASAYLLISGLGFLTATMRKRRT